MFTHVRARDAVSSRAVSGKEKEQPRTTRGGDYLTGGQIQDRKIERPLLMESRHLPSNRAHRSWDSPVMFTDAIKAYAAG
jgi:hypothetical protein